MGGYAAKNIIRAGFETYVFDLRPEAGNDHVAMGGTWAGSPAEMITKVDCVVSMVFGPPHLDAVLNGPEGLLKGNCRSKLWVDMTTLSPKFMRELMKPFLAAGGCPVDAPVTGSVDAAIRGDMPMFVGGDDADVECVRPVIEAMGELRKVGRYGNGYVAKLVNSQLWKVHAAAIGEAMVCAKKAGLEPDVWWKVMKGEAADSFVLQHDVPSIFAGHYDPSFPIKLCLEDLSLIKELMDETGTRSDLTDTTYARFREAGDRYGVNAGEMTVCKIVEDDAGVQLRVKGDWIAPWEVTYDNS
ncbi:NAD(P)-dependent oxidoreductase [Mesorhizobium sp. CN2-181]|uniref:NAD(P)-dependent oxidoreductase n=1 Tax=Mesorhizobium yinganensis TaxID=3157707 RepID=UPI0032B83B4A